MSNRTNTTLYIGVTNDLIRRVYEHRQGLDPKSFTARYNLHKLVYYESCSSPRTAIEREKQLKGWNRARKNRLVESVNPSWHDLYDTIVG